MERTYPHSGRMALDIGLLTLIVTVSLPVVAFLMRKRLGRWLYRTALAAIQEDWFDFETQDVTKDGKTVHVRVLRPNERTKQLLGSIVPSFIELALQSIKIKLPKFAPINPATGQLDFTAGIAAKFAEGKNVRPEEIAKALFMQFGMPLLEQKLVPMLQGLTANIGVGGPPTAGDAKETPNPFLKELGQ